MAEEEKKEITRKPVFYTINENGEKVPTNLYKEMEKIYRTSPVHVGLTGKTEKELKEEAEKQKTEALVNGSNLLRKFMGGDKA